MENLLIDEEYKNEILDNKILLFESLIEYIVNNYDIQEIIDELQEYLPDSETDEEELEDINVGVDKEGFYYLK